VSLTPAELERIAAFNLILTQNPGAQLRMPGAGPWRPGQCVSCAAPRPPEHRRCASCTTALRQLLTVERRRVARRWLADDDAGRATP
jgi:hypothetical protein